MKVRRGMGETARQPEKKRSVGSLIVNILGAALCVIFIPLIILNTTLIVKSYTDPDKLPMVFGVSPVIVLSGSMVPVFRAGDMIFLKEVDPATLQIDDIICYFAEGKETAVTHKIVEIQEQDGQRVFITKGDANNVEDRIAVTYDMVQGKYTGFYIAGLGDLAIFLQSTAGMVVCIVCPLLLIVLWDVVRRMVSSRKKEGSSKAMEEELERLRAQVAQQQAEEQGQEEPPAS